MVGLAAKQSQAQLEKGHCAVNVHLQARIEALLGRLGTIVRMIPTRAP